MLNNSQSSTRDFFQKGRRKWVLHHHLPLAKSPLSLTQTHISYQLGKAKAETLPKVKRKTIQNASWWNIICLPKKKILSSNPLKAQASPFWNFKSRPLDNKALLIQVSHIVSLWWHHCAAKSASQKSTRYQARRFSSKMVERGWRFGQKKRKCFWVEMKPGIIPTWLLRSLIS